MSKTTDDEATTLYQVKYITSPIQSEAVTYLNIYGNGVSDVSHIGQMKSLRICLLPNNYITDISPLMKCKALIKLDASSNKISTIPPDEDWANLTSLKILYLHDNTISKLAVFQDIAGAPNIHVLTMFDTPVSLTKHYRHHAVNTIWSLQCLDQLVVSDEEVIEDAKFKDKFCAYHPSLRIGPLPYISHEMTESDAIKQSKCTLKLVEGVLRRHSPVIIIQHAWRNSRYRQRQAEIVQLRHWAAVCIQRFWRLQHDIPQITPGIGTRDVFSPLTAVQTPMSGDKTITPQSVKVTPSDPEPPTGKVAFRISSARLRESVNTKTSFIKIWGAVPFKAGLQDSVFAKRSAAVEEAKPSPSCDVTSPVSSELELVAERTSLQEPNTFRDMIMSCREAGRVVREAACHYRQIEKYRPKPEKKLAKTYNPVSNSQRLFTKQQDTMALSCLRAVQQAYKNRAQIEGHAARMDQVLLQRHQHKVMLARVDAIKNASRIETLHQRELDDSRLRDNHYKLQDLERREMIAVMKKRNKEKVQQKDQKQYKQFLTDFCCQNASLSKALARHDRRAIRDDIAANSQEKVTLLREQNQRSQRTVTEYKDFVKLRRQAEAQYDRAQVHTVLYEERKQREEDVIERIEYLKTLKAEKQETAQVNQNDVDHEVVWSSYQTTEVDPSVLRGVAIQPGASSSTKKRTPSHMGTIRFDLTLPDVHELSSKVSLSQPDSLEPVKLTRLFLNDSPNFPVVPQIPTHERDLVI